MTQAANPPSRTGQSVLFVHAHPDDETINNGATMARYVAEGARVTLVTCTLGELGEVIPPRLAHLAAERDDVLGEYRVTELTAAMAALGVTDFRLLGGAGRFRDSGMMGTEGNDDPRAFWQADVDEAAALLARIVREARPQVLVTYNEFGGYGHPDHIQAHRVAMRGAELAADPHFAADGAGEPHEIAKIYWITVPRSVIEAGFKAVRAASAETGLTAPESMDDVPFVSDDATVTAVVNGEAYLDRKIAAMRAHATQIILHEPFFGLSNGLGLPISGVEYYQLVKGGPAADRPEDDLFAGTGAGSGE